MPCITLILLLVVASSLDAEFLRVEVAFQDTGCVSCIASLEGRLGRVRGMERVEIDPDRGVAVMHLAPKNRVRLTPLLARITQDGTKILGTKVEARGSIESLRQGLTFTPAGINQTYRLALEGEAEGTIPESNFTYRLRGRVEEIGPGSEALLTASTVKAEAR
jgi:copper chaperone CopZ